MADAPHDVMTPLLRDQRPPPTRGAGLTSTVKTFSGAVVHVTDGDTLKLAVRLRRSRGADRDYGFSVYREGGWLVLHYSFRLLGCNAAERGTPGGDAATANLTALLPAGTVVGISSVRDDKYSRYDASISLADGTDLVTKLIAEQWAAPWDGTGPRPVPPWPRTVGTVPGPTGPASGS